jgi:hypothetical protein
METELASEMLCIFKKLGGGQRKKLCQLTLEAGTDRMSQNFGAELLLYAA